MVGGASVTGRGIARETGGGLVVSAVVCTRDRPRLLARALRSVFSQDWLRDPANASGFELVVADDGDGPPPNLAGMLPPAGLWRPPEARLLRTGYRGPGAARSEGFDAARGRYVAFCDDDDEWAPGHLGTLLGYLLDHPEADLAYGDLAVARGGAPQEPVPSAPEEPLTAEGLLRANPIRPSAAVFRADVAHDLGGFCAGLRAHEDLDLWLRLLRHGRVLRKVPKVVGLRGRPEDRVSAEHAGVRDRERGRVLAAHRRALAARDKETEPDAGDGGAGAPDETATAGPPTPAPSALRRGPTVPFDRSTWGRGRGALVWHSVLRAHEGYGSAGRELLLTLERRGVDVALAPGVVVPRGLERFRTDGEAYERLGFYYDHEVRPSAMRCERLISYSMWESTRVPRDHVEEINRASSLHYVPCRQDVESHLACGVRVPVRVLHHGVDAGRFPLLERPRDRGPYTFGTFGDLSPRKGVDVLVRAFLDEFGRGEPARLILKSTAPKSALGGLVREDPRVELVGGFLGREALLELLRRMDAFVLPSRGEGFGLCGLEAMATGLPLIATDWGGPSEYLDPADSYPLSYDLVNAGGARSNNARYFGLWAEPSYEHLRHLMRLLYERPEKGAEKGRLAASRAREEWTWDRAAARIPADLDALAKGASADDAFAEDAFAEDAFAEDAFVGYGGG